MKKTIMAVAAAVMMSVSALAQQEVQPQQAGGEPRQMDKTELVKQHTERMVTEYGLNADQAAKLLEVNTQYFDKMPFMMMRGQRGGQRGQRPQQMRGGQRPQRMGGDSLRFGGQRPQRIGGERGQRPMMNREERRGLQRRGGEDPDCRPVQEVQGVAAASAAARSAWWPAWSAPSASKQRLMSACTCLNSGLSM